MTPRSVLITGVGGDIGQSIIKCLRDFDAGRMMKIVGCDIDQYAAGRNDVDLFLHAPKAIDESQYFNFIGDLVKNFDVGYIFPTTEIEINFFNHNRRAFADKDVKLMINNSEIIKRFFDKYETAVFLGEKGFCCPKTYLAKEYDGQLKYPLIIKPRTGSSSRNVFKVENGRDLEFYSEKVKDAIIQEYVGSQDQEYTTGIFSDRKNTFSITLKRTLGFDGVSKTVQVCQDDSMKRIAERFAEAVELFGAVNLQSRKTDKGFSIFEVNPRISSTVYFRSRFGFRDVEWWIGAVDGERAAYTPSFHAKIGVRALTEKFFNEA